MKWLVALALLLLAAGTTAALAEPPSLAPSLDAISTALAGIHVPARYADTATPAPTDTPTPRPTPRPTCRDLGNCLPTGAPATPTPQVIVHTVSVPAPAPAAGGGAVETTITTVPPTPAPGAGAAPYATFPYGCGSTCGGGGAARDPK